ncbi:MAG: M14 family metallopeptidase [Bacillota bacterium]|nr:M14 family metallopeptidase [Bacillota bacterium]
MRALIQGLSESEIMEIQGLLIRLGYYRGEADGKFGRLTEQALAGFQRSYGATPEEVIGEDTCKMLWKFLQGYDTYTIKPGEIIDSVAVRFSTTANRILAANPGLAEDVRVEGQNIVVPYGINVVDTNINYTYEIMEKNIQSLRTRYPFIEVGTAGKSVLGRYLYYIKLGSGPREVFYNGSHHSLEWITSVLLMKFVENYSKAYVDGTALERRNVRDMWRESTIYVMPMVNPDGVDLVINGLQSGNPYYNDLIRWNKGSKNFSRVWQANIRGVDLNHNYDASWSMSKAAEGVYGITGPGPTRFSGTAPESEPESRAVADFTRKHAFRLVLAYHSQGELIYWTYSDKTPLESSRIVQHFARVSGYKPDQTSGIASYGGYKDWFIDKFGKPGFTIEVGRGTNPLPISQFSKIYKDNIGILLMAAVI